MTYTTPTGTSFSDEDIERWAGEAEAGFPGARFGKSSPGRPVSVGAEAKPFTLRLDLARREKLNEAASSRHVSVSQLVRDLIDSL